MGIVRDFAQITVLGPEDYLPVITDIGGGMLKDRLIKKKNLNSVLGKGTYAIGNNAGGVTVTGLGLSAVPSLVQVWIIKQAGQLNISAWYIDGTATTDGFTVEFNATTDSTFYKLGYVLYF